jgi:hypothetical protein
MCDTLTAATHDITQHKTSTSLSKPKRCIQDHQPIVIKWWTNSKLMWKKVLVHFNLNLNLIFRILYGLLSDIVYFN